MTATPYVQGCPECAKLTSGRCAAHSNFTVTTGTNHLPITGGYVPSLADALAAVRGERDALRQQV